MQYMLRTELFELPIANLPLLVQLLNLQCILIHYEENMKRHDFEKDINIKLEFGKWSGKYFSIFTFQRELRSKREPERM